MRAALVAAGWDARVFAENWTHGVAAAGAAEASDFLKQTSALVIYHQSTRWDLGMELLQETRGPILIRDHNVTPERYFSGVSDEFVAAARRGAAQRRRLARDPRVARFLPASRFNADELRALGAPADRIAVFPPFHRVDALEAAAPTESTLRRWASAPADILFVGRVAPNKGHRRILRAAAIYRELYGQLPTLRFVGRRDPRLHSWSELLDDDCARLGLGGSVEFVGEVDEGDLKAAYLTSRIFLCCSEHEGFCVPLVEAAMLGLPIIATGQQGVAETLGSSALVLHGASEELVAVAVRRVLFDPDVRDTLVARQREHFSTRYSSDVIQPAFLAAVEQCLSLGAGVAIPA